MMTRISAIAGLALLAACGSASVADSDASAQTRAPAKPLAIAGVRIGMSATDAQATLTRDGWKVQTFAGKDWAATVEEERKRQRSISNFDAPRKGVDTLQASKGDEAIIVDLRPVPTGAEVRFVKYEAPMAGRNASQVQAELERRYGSANITSGPGAPLASTWCSDGERCRGALAAAKPALGANEDVYHKLRLSLSSGTDGDRAWQAAVQRAAGGGRSASSSF